MVADNFIYILIQIFLEVTHMSNNPNELYIKETLKKQLQFSICCLIWLWAIAILIPVLSIVQPVENTNPILIISISIILGIGATIITICIYMGFMRGTSMLRTFKISKENIEFNAPTQESLKINWVDIDRVIIKRIAIGYRFGKVWYHIKFEGNEDKSYKLESGKECSNNTLKSILSTLEAYCNVLNKDFVRD
jgi:hypothetical protein